MKAIAVFLKIFKLFKIVHGALEDLLVKYDPSYTKPKLIGFDGSKMIKLEDDTVVVTNASGNKSVYYIDISGG